MKNIFILSLILLLTIPAFSASKKRVAVMNFKNYGGKSLKFLSKSIPESISTTLADTKSVNVVERGQLGKILNEIALEQSGAVDTGGISRAGKLSKADVLILGSLSGKRSSIIVNIKAVNVKTGKVISGSTVRGSMSDIFDKVESSTRSIAAILSGKGVGKVSISTTPSKCDVYIDGVNMGKSPIVEATVVDGKHRIKVSKDGHLDHDETVYVGAKKHRQVNIILETNKWAKVAFWGFGARYLKPINGSLKGSPNYFVYMGQNYYKLSLIAEFNYSEINHSYDMNFIGRTVNEKRNYDLFGWHVNVLFNPFQNNKYISPYAGGTIGYTRIKDMRGNAAKDDGWFEDNLEELKLYHLLSLGGVGGVKLFPYNNISFFLEGRFYFHPKDITRDIYGETSFIEGKKIVSVDKFKLNYWTVGGGITFHFTND